MIEAGEAPGSLLTLDDLQALPEDGRRYELVDGSLHVSPPPAFGHQVVVTRLQYLLRDAARPTCSC